MGVEWEIACDETREVFDLGKGDWTTLDLTPCDVDALRGRIVAALPSAASEPEWTRALATRMHTWLDRVGWRVYLANDYNEPEQPVWSYAVIGARYDPVQKRVEANGGRFFWLDDEDESE